ncbi:maker410 [Drosophila busckii]|uniref:Maker410 n=1 Tax=Drosophila busckii TaxID=30019 RepID=A0A0M4EAN0_DROBS|nr:maker410 [Drosophila busckii]
MLKDLVEYEKKIEELEQTVKRLQSNSRASRKLEAPAGITREQFDRQNSAANSDLNLNNIKQYEGYATSCLSFGNSNNIQTIRVPGTEPFQVRCKSEIVGNGWTVILNKARFTSNFNRTWTEYKQGFGDLNDEFFIGLEKLHLMTKFQPHEIYIKLHYVMGALDFARYSNFSIGNEVESYKLLNYGSYTGSFNFLEHNLNMKFTTLHRDNDNHYSRNCAYHYDFGWWYNKCHWLENNVWISSGKLVVMIRPTDCKNVNETLQKEVERLKANIREQEINISTLSAKVAADLKLDNFTEASSCLPLGNSNEIQTIRIPGTEPFQVRCISNSTSHGWTLILRKEFGTESFNQPWSEYEHGFGDLSGEFFIGVEKLQLMTKYQPHELLIKLITQSDYDEHHPYYVEHYDKFSFDRLSLIHTVGVHRYFHPILDGISDIKLSAPDRDRNNIYDDIFKCVSKVKFAFGYRLCMDSYPHMKMDLMMRPKILTQNEN